MGTMNLITSNTFPFLDYISGGMMLAVIAVFSLAVFYKIKLILKAEWQFASYLELFTSFSCVAVIAMYAYLFINLILGDVSNVTNFGIIVVRPVLFILGASIASHTRYKFVRLKYGGEQWTLRKFKI